MEADSACCFKSNGTETCLLALIGRANLLLPGAPCATPELLLAEPMTQLPLKNELCASGELRGRIAGIDRKQLHNC